MRTLSGNYEESNVSTKIIIVVIGILFSGLVGYIGYDTGMKAGIVEGAAGATGAQGAQGRFGAGGNFPGGASGTANPGGGANNGGNANGGGGFGNNPAAAFAGGIQGTVDSVDGKTLTVTITRGQQTQQVKVTLADGGTVEQLATGKPADVKVGQRIQIGVAPVAGATPAAGGAGAQIPSEVTARSITILPANP
jgi:hypothetical protein